MIENESDRVNVLLALLRNVQAELVRYRDKEWQITAYVVGLDLAIAGVYTRPGLAYQLLSSIFLVIVGGAGVYFLGFVHTRLNRARVMYNTILFRLGLDEILTEGAGPDGFQFSSDRGPSSELLRPRGRRQLGFSEGRGVEFVLSFMVLIFVVTAFAVVIVLARGAPLTDFM